MAPALAESLVTRVRTLTRPAAAARPPQGPVTKAPEGVKA
jgi:hypothetical protein